MRLPSAAATYDRREQDETRRTIETEFLRVSTDVGALRASTVISRVSTAVNVVIAAPLVARDGYVYTLDVKNTSAGVITVTLNAVFLGTFPAPAAGKRRTQMYSYDAAAALWIPVGAQSPDL